MQPTQTLHTRHWSPLLPRLREAEKKDAYTLKVTAVHRALFLRALVIPSTLIQSDQILRYLGSLGRYHLSSAFNTITAQKLY